MGLKKKSLGNGLFPRLFDTFGFRELRCSTSGFDGLPIYVFINRSLLGAPNLDVVPYPDKLRI